jgi:hypothetical protein
MMKKIEWRLVIGIIMLAFGGLMLLQSLHVLPSSNNFGEMLVSLMFIAGGSIFLMQLFVDMVKNWWAVIPAGALFSLGIIIFGDSYFPRLMDQIGGGIFLGGIAAAFWAAYFIRKPDFWWALIPAGVLTTLALIAIEPVSNILPADFLFLFGTSATFASIAFTVKPREKSSWAWIPSGILFFIGCIRLLTEFRTSILIPVLFILAGLFILLFPRFSKILKGERYE